jgi:hypothetical protein
LTSAKKFTNKKTKTGMDDEQQSTKLQHPTLALCRPQSQYTNHELTIVLAGDNGQWTTTLDLDTRVDAPSRLLVFELPTAVQKSTGQMRQTCPTQSEFAVKLTGPPHPATPVDLSSLPLSEWMSTLLLKFAQCPSAIGVLVTRGQVSVTLNEGD